MVKKKKEKRGTKKIKNVPSICNTPRIVSLFGGASAL
jgi:hypothetical protein